MNTYLFSIHKRWNDLIFIEKIKKLEIRKSAPKPPFKAIVYEPFNGGGCGKVIGEFVCNTVENIPVDSEAFTFISKPACLTTDELIEYCSGKDMYGIHINDPILYDKPKELGEFRKPCIMPEMPYCPACKYGNVQYSPDEVECASDLEGASCEWLCLNSVKRPPQSYMRIQGPDDFEKLKEIKK